MLFWKMRNEKMRKWEIYALFLKNDDVRPSTRTWIFGDFWGVIDNALSKKLLNSHLKAPFLANEPRKVRKFALSKRNCAHLWDLYFCDLLSHQSTLLSQETMLLPQETMFNESSTKLQSDGRPVSSSVGDDTLSADNVKSNQNPSASPCLVKCLLQRLCSLFRPSKCSPASNTHPTAEKQPASEPASIPQADKVSSHSTPSQPDGPKNDRAKEGTASSRPRD